MLKWWELSINNHKLFLNISNSWSHADKVQLCGHWKVPTCTYGSKVWNFTKPLSYIAYLAVYNKCTENTSITCVSSDLWNTHWLSLGPFPKTGKGSSSCLRPRRGWTKLYLPCFIPICSSPIWCQQLPGSVSGSGRHWAVPASPGLGGRCRTPAIHSIIYMYKHKHGVLTVIQPFDDSQYTARHVDSWHHIHMQNSYNQLCIGKCITQPLPMGLLLADNSMDKNNLLHVH